jgi:5-carboxymethyl-2-hydroxymuconic-semialdehyde dehydrogenase
VGSVRPQEIKPVKHYIDGQFVDGIAGRTFETINPSDQTVITTVAEGLPEDIDRAARAARRAFDEGPWGRKMTAADRAKLLRKIGDLIVKHGDELALLETLDTGLPIKQARGQAARAAENFYFFAEMATKMMGETFPVGGSFLNYSILRPVGVAGLITPWNTPFMLETWKVAPCLATGNTCVLKPAEWSPLSANFLARIIQEADLPPGVFNVVHGFGETAGAPLVAHPMVNLISFTGETTTGMEIMRNGASTLKRYSMELGGKSPAIIFADADLDAALDAVIFGVFSLNGERCTANSRILVQESIHDAFVERLAERAARIKVGDPFDETTEVGPLIHRDHWKRVMGYIELGRQEGATVKAGGYRPAGLEQGNYIAPTVFVGVKNEMRIAQEEIFGPVTAVIPFKDDEEAIRLANDVKYGLAAYVWTRDLQRGHNVAHAIESGMVWLNSHNVRDLRTPFGGMKYSGIGREGGHYSFEFYCELKTVHVALGHVPVPKFGA